MKIRKLALLLVMASATSLVVVAQAPPMLLPAPVEKDLAARAANVTEVTLGKNMLEFAAKFMKDKDGNDAATRQLIMGLDGIYVRDYEFEKPGEYSMEHVEQIRQAFNTPEWSSMVRERERKTGESTDVMVKLVNGESRGLFVLSAEPKELAVVLILGPIRMDDLNKVMGMSGVGGMIGPTGPLSGVQHTPRPKEKEKDKKDETKDKPKDKTDKNGGAA
jgi:hypothetical protein